jgi:hypothetical protein
MTIPIESTLKQTLINGATRLNCRSTKLAPNSAILLDTTPPKCVKGIAPTTQGTAVAFRHARHHRAALASLLATATTSPLPATALPATPLPATALPATALPATAHPATVLPATALPVGCPPSAAVASDLFQSTPRGLPGFTTIQQLTPNPDDNNNLNIDAPEAALARATAVAAAAVAAAAEVAAEA